jgi:DNA-binding GntR family transcriptional regulator
MEVAMQGIMKQVIFREDQVPSIQSLAERFGVNRSVIVRWAVDEYVQKTLSSGSLKETISPSINRPIETPAETAAN